jgi:hypothetical protein
VKEIMRTNDLVVVSFARSLLEDAGIAFMVADEHISAMEGAIGAFPRRFLVEEDHVGAARSLLDEAGLGIWLVAR